MSAMIQFDQVYFGYTDNQHVLKEINLSIRQGEFVALIGGNGSGKTTLAKHCNGLYKPTSGAVYVNGRDTKDWSVAELSGIVSYCYQNPDHQIFQSTVWEEVSFGPKNLGLSPEEIELRVSEALRAVGLDHLRSEEPYFAGKGTRQKIAVASILAMKPQMIVLDEPTTGLDHRGVVEMMALIQQLHRDGHTILVITHDMRLVAEYAQRVIVLHRGEMICDGSPQAVFAQPDLLALAQVEPPAVCRFSLSAGLLQPLPLTYSALLDKLAKELKGSNR
jgi:energy-coupling factor transport system ATP-binding protein